MICSFPTSSSHRQESGQAVGGDRWAAWGGGAPMARQETQERLRSSAEAGKAWRTIQQPLRQRPRRNGASE